MSADVEMLLAGLEVESIAELRRLVAYGRGLVVTPNQREAIEGMFPNEPVILRGAEREGYFGGAIHVDSLDESRIRGVVLSPERGCLGVDYDALMSLPVRDDRP